MHLRAAAGAPRTHGRDARTFDDTYALGPFQVGQLVHEAEGVQGALALYGEAGPGARRQAGFLCRELLVGEDAACVEGRAPAAVAGERLGRRLGGGEGEEETALVGGVADARRFELVEERERVRGERGQRRCPRRMPTSAAVAG
ncbi:hypothetical protein OGH68_35420 [Streptomyces peucetius]|uniref:Uncharacterized protein n=1 Tax=Streptomyces peucetius TaxID=1950 RepID=A0ABY6IIH2_STRPE|nr:hypothetical protein [Streptomyces peucetius]UYQ66822.1 hypothetical protein OGH68_35420 [Streptomyces peucetius]